MGAAFAAEFEPGAQNLMGTAGPDEAVVRAQVAAQGFYDGPPVGVEPCGRCHPDVAAAWGASAHRFASFNNPYYVLGFEGFVRDRGVEASVFCAGCHDPLLVARGEAGRPVDAASPAAQAGITCLVCHSIVHASARGNGEYRARVDPVPYLEHPAHGARLVRGPLKSAALCGSCHKVGLGEAVTQDRWLRGQDEYDSWYDSSFAGRGAGAVWRAEQVKTCQDCHMPRVVASAEEKGAKDGRIRSHRFLGAHLALPHLRGDPGQLRETETFLRGSATVALHTAEPGTVDVVLRSVGVAHRFPAGTTDSHQVWVEWTAWDGAGRILRQSGGVTGGVLDPASHLLRVQPVDGEGWPIARRDAHRTRGAVYDTTLKPAEPRVVRYALPPGTRRVRARLRYRKFSSEFAQAACAGIDDPAVRERCGALPVAEVGEAAASVLGGRVPRSEDWRALVDHGLALAGGLARHAVEAEAPLRRAVQLAPGSPEPWLGLARAAGRLGRTDAALALLDEAARRGNLPAIQWQRAWTLHRAYRNAAARVAAEAVLAALPNDRHALGLVARLRGLVGDTAGALAAADRLLALDPEFAEGWLQRALALEESKAPGVDEARAKWARHRGRPGLELVLRKRFRAQMPAQAQALEPVPLR
jgi:hypothetical protein